MTEEPAAGHVGAPGAIFVPLADQLKNHDGFAPEPSTDLDGRRLVAYFKGGVEVEVEVEAGGVVRWRSSAPTLWGREGVESSAEAVLLRPWVYLLIVPRLGEGRSALVFLDLKTERALVNLTSFVDEDGRVQERTGVFSAGIDGELQAPFERTTELVGKRVAHRYSTTHLFEHIYLNPSTYAFQCLAGPEEGLADVDRADYYKLGERLYLLSWHERAQPFNGAVVVDLLAGRANGRLVGWDPVTKQALQARTGSIATLLSETSYEGL